MLNRAFAEASHGIGVRNGVTAMSRAAVAAGADGLIIEVVETLERLGVPFTGATSDYYEPSREAMKRVCRAEGIAAPADVLVRSGEDVERALADLREGVWPDELMPLIRGFMTILYIGVPFIVVGMVGMASMRATGDTRLPSKIMIIGSILNVALDPVLIFGLGPIPALGLNGAALAALIARGMIFLAALYLLRYRLDMVSFNRPDPAELRSSWRDILHVGIPAAGTNAIVPVGAAVITAMIARYGPDAVAGFGVASRIESLMLVPYYAMSAIIGPFVGQNLSAGRDDRIVQALRLCAGFCIVSGLVIAAALALLANALPALFSDSPAVISVARSFLWIAPLGYGAYGVVMVMNAAFNGMGHPMPGVAVSVKMLPTGWYLPATPILGTGSGVTPTVPGLPAVVMKSFGGGGGGSDGITSVN